MYFFIIAGFSWLIAQTMKVVLESVIGKKLVLKRYFGDGGYPSCHSSFVTGGFVAVLFKYDWSNFSSVNTDSMVLAVFAILWVQITRDALGARLQQGQTAKTVNEITEYFRQNIDDNLFKLLPMLKTQGHLPHEVIAGVVTGTITAISTILIIDKGQPLMAIISGTLALIVVIIIGLLVNLKKGHK